MVMVQEVFHHEDVDGTRRHFAIPVLRAMICRQPDQWHLATLPVTREQMLYVRRNGSVDERRLRSYPLAKLDEPGIALLFPDETILIVDGNHRFVKRYRRGLSTMQFWTAPEAVWRDALVDGRHLVTIG